MTYDPYLYIIVPVQPQCPFDAFGNPMSFVTENTAAD